MITARGMGVAVGGTTVCVLVGIGDAAGGSVGGTIVSLIPQDAINHETRNRKIVIYLEI
jgi:hypothetical protein